MSFPSSVDEAAAVNPVPRIVPLASSSVYSQVFQLESQDLSIFITDRIPTLNKEAGLVLVHNFSTFSVMGGKADRGDLAHTAVKKAASGWQYR